MMPSKKYLIGLLLLAALFLGGFGVFSATRPPQNFPVKTLISVSDGDSLSAISRELEKEGVIRHAFLLTNLVIFFGRERGVVAGEYYFEKPATVVEVARAVAEGNFGLVSVRITIPEGTTAAQMAALFSQKLPRFSAEEFLNLTNGKEGYLFPDTYLFLPGATARDVALQLEQNFSQKIQYLASDIQKSGHSLSQIITMASILEEEARSTESRRMVAGILWHRIALSIPLQVDSVFPYINGKTTSELSVDDLKIDSPYNTYLYKGLPPGPISNPGLDSILAAIHPISSKYLYYLSDKEGQMHYAVTFEEHKRNKEKYLQ